MPDVLVVSGPAGVGKSTLCWELGSRLQEAGVAHVCLDADELDRAHPPVPGLFQANLDAFRANARPRRLVVCGVFVEPPWLGHDALVVGLDAPDDVLEARVRERELPHRAEAQLARTLAYAAAIRARADRITIDTAGRAVAEVADEVLALTGWLDGRRIVVRPYEPHRDEQACRALWVELTEHHRRLYGDPTIGGDDPGSYFTGTYLRLPERVASWVAEVDGEVVGLTGLLDHGTSGEVEPIVVAERRRGQGIGQRLIQAPIDEARRRGHDRVSIRPVARNAESIRAFHAMGFGTLGGVVDLTMDLRPRRHRWRDEPQQLHGRPFRW